VFHHRTSNSKRQQQKTTPHEYELCYDATIYKRSAMKTETNPQWAKEAQSLVNIVRVNLGMTEIATDADIARVLCVSTSQLSNFKTGRKRIGPAMKLRLIAYGKLTVKQINKIMETSK
jgi:hypothetical protein